VKVWTISSCIHEPMTKTDRSRKKRMAQRIGTPGNTRVRRLSRS
jgi:hypothetical protein